MKQKQKNTGQLQQGFTIIELLVVLAIMVVIATVLILDFSSQRDSRNIVLARNETVTNIRKIQNYMLSSRNIAEGVPAKFYIAEFRLDDKGSVAHGFTVHGIDSDFMKHTNIETINLPDGINYTNLQVDPPGSGKPISYPCLQLIFSSPFGKMYVNGASDCDNNIETTLRDPVALAELSQRRATLEISNSTGSISSEIIINPITGQLTAN